MNIHNSSYFNSLPKMIQESIIQSGVRFESDNDLEMFVSNLGNKGSTERQG